eukprot:80551_1
MEYIFGEYETYFGPSDAQQKEAKERSRKFDASQKLYRDTPLSKAVTLYQTLKQMINIPVENTTSRRTNKNHLMNPFEYQRRYIENIEIAMFPATANIQDRRIQMHVDSAHLHLDLDHFVTYENALKYIDTNRHDIEYQYLARNYKLCLHYIFAQKLKQFNSLKRHINKRYTLFIHAVTLPQSPQVWRRIKINGSCTLLQFDEIINQLIGFGRGHNYEFRFNLIQNKHFQNAIKNIKTGHSLIRQGELRMTNLQIPNHVDRIVNRLTLHDATSMDIGEILIGQIFSLYDTEFERFHNKIPYDEFMDTHYPEYYRLFSDLQHSKGYTFDRNMRYDNFSYDNDCLQWIYDMGSDWRFNIYVEHIEDINLDIYENTRSVEYIDGSGIAIPDDVGNFEDWYLLLLKSLNKYMFLVCDMKTSKEVYDWIKNHQSNKYYCQTWLDSNGWNCRLFPEWLDKMKYPYLKPYNINMNEYMSRLMMERSLMCLLDEDRMDLRKLRLNITKNKQCFYCQSFKGKLQKCSACRQRLYCSKSCQKKSWKNSHRYVCKYLVSSL